MRQLVFLSAALFLFPQGSYIWGTDPFLQAGPEGKQPAPDKRVATPAQRQLADDLLRLRQTAHAWLDRDLAVEKRPFNRAYADLIFAFALARLNQEGQSRKLVQDALAELDAKDPIHQFLGQAYSYRIEQALAGRPHVGPLPGKLFQPLAKLPEKTDGRLVRFKVERMLDWSRILQPQERSDPFLPWRAVPNDLQKQAVALGNLRADDKELEYQLGRLLKAAEEQKVRAFVLTQGLSLAPRLSAALQDKLLEQALPLLREMGTKGDKATLEKQGALLERAIVIVAARGQVEPAKKLTDWSLEWTAAARDQQLFDSIAGVVAEHHRSLRKLGLRDYAGRWSVRCKDLMLDGKSLDELRKDSGDNWWVVLRVFLFVGRTERYAGKPERSEATLTAARSVVFPGGAEKDQKRLPPAFYAKVAMAYAAMITQMPAKEAVDGVDELFTKMEKLSANFTTETHFSRLHLMVLEEAVLGFELVTE
jgi:hypothetical protein